jgi:hypothetical protein
MYQNLKHVLPVEQQADCVHYEMIPAVEPAQQNAAIELRVARMQTVIELGRTARDKAKLTMKRPLKSVLVVHSDAKFLDDVRALSQYVGTELNVRSVEFSSEVDKFILLKAAPNRKALGARFGKTSAEFAKAVGELTHAQLLELQSAGSVAVKGEQLTGAEIDVSMVFQGDKSKQMDCGNNDALVIINIEEDAQLVQESLAREVTRRVQQLRKEAGCVPTDDIECFYAPPAGVDPASSAVCAAIAAQSAFIGEILGRGMHPATADWLPRHAVELIRGTLELEGEAPVTLVITRVFVSFDDAAVKQLALPAEVAQAAQDHVAHKEWAAFHRRSQTQADYEVSVDGHKVVLHYNKHFFFHLKDKAAALKQ